MSESGNSSKVTLSSCNNPKVSNDGSLDDEITLLESTLINSTDEEKQLCNNDPNDETRYSGSNENRENLFNDYFDIEDINLSMQLTYPANPSVLSSIKHMESIDKQVILDDSSSYSVISKSNTDPFTSTNNPCLHVTSNNYNSSISVQNKDCDIIISQCDSSLEDSKLFTTDTSLKSLNFVIQSNDADTNTLTVDNDIILCNSSEIKNSCSSKILSEIDSYVPVLNNSSVKMSSQNMSVSGELGVKTSMSKGSESNFDLLYDNMSDANVNKLRPLPCKEELENDKGPQSQQQEEMKLVNVITENSFSTTNNSNEQTNVEKYDQNKSSIFCSTPISVKHSEPSLQHSKDVTSNTFGPVSPLTSLNCKNKLNLKRKIEHLAKIEEVDEDCDILEKKLKCDENSEVKENLSETNDYQVTPTLQCYETAALSILKMWQPTYLSRTSAAQYLVIDETSEAESDSNDQKGNDQDQQADDFELAYKSLTEELMKSSSNIETLEKYHSQVQLESQIDDDKFDEVFLELTQKFELGDKTCLSLKTMDESAATENEKTLINTTSDDVLNDITNADVSDCSPEGNKTVVEVKPKTEQDADGRSGVNVTIKVMDDPSPNALGSKSESTDGVEQSVQSTSKQQPTVVHANEKDAAMAEEDYLLEEAADAGQKPYEFVEYVSTDPKENEDNNHPEWQKLGSLTTDEERYKAVRDRWRSLVPPDPNKDLTCRQWRKRNNKPPLNIGSFNNNESKGSQPFKNQHCTSVFEIKINKIVQELEDRRMGIMFTRNRGFEDLAMKQDNEQRMLCLRHCSEIELSELRCQHLMECRQLKDFHDRDLRMIEHEAEDRIKKLKTASYEVKLFQKFYRGVGDTAEFSEYLSNLEVQELLETEEMLEQYTKFYG